MADRWLRFNQRKQNDLIDLRRKLQLTLYGSFRPSSEKKLLTRLKRHLIEQGFSNTRLVSDFSNVNSLDILEISKECLEFSHVNFLIFTRQGKRHGVIRELAFVADSPAMKHKISDCMVFDQILNNKSSVPPLSKMDIKNTGLVKREFTTELGLRRIISRCATWQIGRLRNTILLE